ncbi:hypothetical protein M231_01656 [Tremella mesenterica]|uniref:Nucleolar 27S pre-rRNA processing Urb2/Npa2 C-terminal domain-containing protein n=1 Tax=Tremella mesenterica TaxID=5217 RepID=A0A4Q1BSK8_TREME|nr:hypothetical protein M231_01656 [Tremella mesenterica]
MVGTNEPSHISTSAALIKSLKAPSDPPVPQTPYKIDLAREAWSNPDFHVPRKAELIRDWIIETWLRPKDVTASDINYHQLFRQIWKACPRPIVPPLNLILHLLRIQDAEIQNETTLKEIIATVLLILPNVDEPRYQLDAWLDIWSSFLKLIFSHSMEDMEVESRMRELGVEIIPGLKTALHTRPRVLPLSVSLSLSHALSLDRLSSLQLPLDIIQDVFLPPSIFNDKRALQSLLEDLRKAANPSTQAAIVKFSIYLLKSFIHTAWKDRQELYTQPSSSKVTFERFVSDKAADSILSAVVVVRSSLDNLNTDYSAESYWMYKDRLWEVVEEEGCYSEINTSWRDILQNDSQQAQETLSSARLNTGDSNPNLEHVLAVLARLERLDHKGAHLRVGAVGSCFMVKSQTSVACLQALLRYHRLTSSLDTFVDLMSQALGDIFGESTNDDDTRRLYDLILSGPFVDPRFLGDMEEALKAPHLRTVSEVWRRLVRSSCDLTRAWIEVSSTPDKSINLDIGKSGQKRKHQEMSFKPGSAATIALISRLQEFILAAEQSRSKDRSSDPSLIVEVWDEVTVIATEIREINKKKRKHTKQSQSSDGSKDEWYEILMAAYLRISRIHTLYTFVKPSMGVDTVIGFINTPASCETLKAALGYMVARFRNVDQDAIETPLVTVFLDQCLRLLSTRTPEGSNLTGEIWEMLLKGGARLIELTSPKSQLDVWATTILTTVSSSYNAEDTHTGTLINRFLQGAEIWDLPNLSRALVLCSVKALKEESHLDAGMIILAHSALAKSLPRNEIVDIISKTVSLLQVGDMSEVLERCVLSLLAQLAKAQKLRLSEDQSIILLHYIRTSASNLPNAALRHILRVSFECVCKGDLERLNEIFDERREVKSLDLVMVTTFVNVISHNQKNSVSIDTALARLIHKASSMVVWAFQNSLLDISEILRCWTVMCSLHDQLNLEPPSLPVTTTEILIRVKNIQSPEERRRAYTILFEFPEFHLSGKDDVAVRNKYDQSLLLPLLRHSLQHSPNEVVTILPSLLTTLSSSISPDTGVETLEFLVDLVKTKHIHLSTSDLTTICHIPIILLSTFSSPSTSTISTSSLSSIPVPTSSSISSDILENIIELLDSLLSHPSIKSLLPPFFSILQTLITSFLPSHPTTIHRRLSRFLIKMSDQSNSSNSISTTFAKHVPGVLVTYVRAVTRGGIPGESRKALEPGILALCSLTVVGGRGDGRGKEGQGVGIPFGLGENGQGEKDVWADMWSMWRKKRYTGQG